MKRAAACLVGLVGIAAWLVPASAHAFGDNDVVKVGGGVLGWVGANFIDKPDDQGIVTLDGQALTAEGRPDYPGFSGVTRGFGFFTEVRFVKYVGLELEVIGTRDSGTADLKVTQSSGGNLQSWEYKAKISSDAVHVPLLLKGVLPGELVSGNIFLGPEFVIPEKLGTAGPAIESDDQHRIPGAPSNLIYGATGKTYTMFTFGLGLEINLPIPGVDIRLPLAIRGGYNPGISSSRTDRADYSITGGTLLEEYKTQWKWEALGTFGVGVHF